MGLFNFGKKKEEQEPACACNASVEETKEESCCCCGASARAEEIACCCNTNTGISSIKILGAGCKSCHEQYENTKVAVKALGLDLEVEYITDMEKVMAYGVMSMPAIVVNEKVVSMGKVLKSADVEKLLHKLGV
ncbi:MAG: thioredoxin family protein [Muricoprocola sp.]